MRTIGEISKELKAVHDGAPDLGRLLSEYGIALAEVEERVDDCLWVEVPDDLPEGVKPMIQLEDLGPMLIRVFAEALVTGVEYERERHG